MSVESWTPGPKPLCHRCPTGPHRSGLLWTRAKGESTKTNLALGGLLEVGAQQFAGCVARTSIPTIDDRDAKAAGRHGMPLGRPILVEGDLQAGDAGHGDDLVLQRPRRMAIAPAVRREQHDAVAGAPAAVVEAPGAFRVEPHQGFDPGIAT